MMVDKTALCPADSFNQMFLVIEDEDGRKRVKVSSSFKPEYLHPSMLIEADANAACQLVLEGQVNLQE